MAGGIEGSRAYPGATMLLLQASDYEAGYAAGQAVGQVLGPCCCVGFSFAIAAGIGGGIYWLVRRSSAASAPPTASQYQFAPGQSPDFAKMQAAQGAALAALGPHQSAETDAVNAAAKKLVARDFDGAIAAYEDVAQRFPHRGGDAHGQIGAAYFFKGDFDRALQHYRHALSLGAPADMMQDNIREAEEAKQKRGY